MNTISQTQAIKEILDGNIVALPTETVYGIFGLANSSKAVSKVYQIKNRPADNPLICHFYSYEQILEHTINQPEYLAILMNEFCPGPITFLLELNPKSELKHATVGQTKVCCRIPDNEFTLQILKEINIPLFGPSANSSTKVSGTNPEIIFEDLGNRLAGIVDGGSCNIGLESTIIDCTNEHEIKILRPGAIGKKEIEEALLFHLQLDSVSQPIHDRISKLLVTEDQKTETTTPGTKYRHYSPRTRIIKIERLPQCHPNFDSESSKIENISYGRHPQLDWGSPTTENKNSNKIYILAFDEDLLRISSDYHKLSLGSIKNPNEIAHNLFQNLFDIDKLNQEQIYFWFGAAAKVMFESNNSVEKAIVNRLNKVFENI